MKSYLLVGEHQIDIRTRQLGSVSAVSLRQAKRYLARHFALHEEGKYLVDNCGNRYQAIELSKPAILPIGPRRGRAPFVF